MSEHLDQSDHWLSEFTDQGMNNWPDQLIVDDLLRKYPFGGGVLYRGMNFDTEGGWEKFLEVSNNGELFVSGGVSSWTRRESTATNFAITRPTYYLNRELMEAESRKRRDNDYMIGAAGVVLMIHIDPSSSIDVNKSRHHKEDEVILPPGTYKAKIHKVFRPFTHAINIDNYSSELRHIDEISSEFNRKKFDHIVNRFNDFSESDSRHMFKLLVSQANSVETQVSVEMTRDNVSVNSREQIPQIYIGWTISDDFFAHYDKFLSEDRALVDEHISTACIEIDEKFKSKTQNIDWENSPFYLSIDRSVTSAISSSKADFEFIDKVNAGIGCFYRSLNSVDNLRKINDLDARGKREFMRDFERKISHSLGQIIHRPSDRLSRAKKAVEFVAGVDKKSISKSSARSL